MISSTTQFGYEWDLALKTLNKGIMEKVENSSVNNMETVLFVDIIKLKIEFFLFFE